MEGTKGSLKAVLKGCGMDHILMPKTSFVKEHKKLLKVLKEGKPKQLKKEYEEQKKELKKEMKGGRKEEKKEKVSVFQSEAEEFQYYLNRAMEELAKEFPSTDLSSLRLTAMNQYDGVKDSSKEIAAFLRPYARDLDKAEWKQAVVDAMAQLSYQTGTDLNAYVDDDLLEDGYDEYSDKPVSSFVYFIYRRLMDSGSSVEDVFSLTPQSGRSEVDEEEKVEEGEGEGGSKNSGFIRRMMAEVKLKHDGEYKYPTKPLSKDSTMNAPVAFDYFKMPKESREMSKHIMSNFFRVRPYKSGEREELNETELKILREAERDRQRRSRASRKQKKEQSE